MVLRMLPGLTLSLMFFIIFIFVPGAAALFMSGRSQRSLPEISMVGSFLFVAAFLFTRLWQDDLTKQLMETILIASGTSKGLINISVIGKVFLFEYILAVVVGLIEFVYRVGVPFKEKSLTTNRGDILQETFITFRKAGIRPRVQVILKDDQKVSGECLKYSWQGKGSVLLKDIDNPDKKTWVPLDDIVKIEFINPP